MGYFACMKLYSLFLPVIAISFSFSPSCENTPQKPADVVFEVATKPIRFVDRTRKVSSAGVFLPSDQLTVKSPLDGTIEKVYVGEGDTVQKGDPLCLFDSTKIKAELEIKKNSLKDVENKLKEYEEAQDEEEEEVPVFVDEDNPKPKKKTQKKPLITQEQVVELGNQKLTLQKEIEAFEANLLALTVNSTISGMVQKKNVTDGSLAVMDDTLFEIVTIDPIALSVNLPEDVSAYVDKLLKAEGYADETPDAILDGTIFYIAPSLDPNTKTLEVRLHLPNPQGKIRGGHTGHAFISTRKVDRALMVPSEAIVERDGKKYVFIVEGTKAVSKEVTLVDNGPEKTNEVEVKAKLRVDDPVIVTGLDKLEDGSLIKVVKQAGEQE